MQRLFSILLLFTFLLGQLEAVNHVYDEHIDEPSCEICITQSQQDNAPATSLPELLVYSSYSIVTAKSNPAYLADNFNIFSIRAPPVFL